MLIGDSFYFSLLAILGGSENSFLIIDSRKIAEPINRFFKSKSIYDIFLIIESENLLFY